MRRTGFRQVITAALVLATTTVGATVARNLISDSVEHATTEMDYWALLAAVKNGK